MARESVPDKTPPQNTADLKAARRGKKEDQVRLIGEGIVNNLSNFVNNFIAKSKSMQLENARNIKRDRTDMFKVFSGAIKEDELLPNILAFKDYLKTSGESVEDFAKGLGENGESFKKTMKAFDDDVKAITTRESALKKAGLVTEQEIVDGKLQLKVLNKSEIRDKQREIINKRKQIGDIEQLIEKETKATDENGRLTVEQKDKIEQLTKNIEELDQGIQDIKNTGVKEVKTVLTGFAGSVSDFYTRQRDSVTGFIDAFMPGPVAQVFNSLVQAVEGLVKQVMDLFKPITATIGAIIKAPRFIAKKFFGKTDKQVDEMFKPLKDFGKKVGSFLLKPFKVVSKFMLDVFLRPFKLVALAFKKLGGYMKKILLSLGLFNMKTLLIVGLLALLGVAIFLFGKKLKEVGEYIFDIMKKIFIKVKNAIQPVVDALVKGFNFLLDAVKSFYNFLFKKQTDESREDRKEKAVVEDDAKEVKKQSKKQLQNLIKEKAKEKGVKVNPKKLGQMDNDQLVKRAQELGVDSEKISRFQRDQAFVKSQEAEDKFLKESKVLYTTKSGQKREIAMSKLLDPQRKGMADLRDRLKDNKQFQEFEKKKAEFDAEQSRIMSGQGNVSNVATNVQQSQIAGVTTKAPTRNTYAPYVDVNAMSY